MSLRVNCQMVGQSEEFGLKISECIVVRKNPKDTGISAPNVIQYNPAILLKLMEKSMYLVDWAHMEAE